MKIDELIDKLVKIREANGNVEVFVPHYELTSDYSYEPQVTYDKSGVEISA